MAPTTARPQAYREELIAELDACGTSEERLTWLYEREPIVPLLPVDRCTEHTKIPGCLSSLWISGQVDNGVLRYQARSDSKMVQGIAAFLCDIASGSTAAAIRELGPEFATSLGLEALLTSNRKQAVRRLWGFVVSVASESGSSESDSSERSAR